MVLLILKLAVIGTATVILCLIINAVYAIRLHKHRYDMDSRLAHERLARSILWTSAFAIILTEITVRVASGYKSSTLFNVHIVFAIVYTVLLGLISGKFNGRLNPKVHRLMGYACACCYGVAYPTGLVLMLKL